MSAPSPKDRLADDQPKCGNCKWMRPIVPHISKPGHWSTSTEYGAPVPGKGACQEPSVGAVYPVLFYVTDLTLCSLWERKE